jgi:hypothetical protein
MRYRVHGISRNTGAETTLIVTAKHHEAAEAIAQRQLVVSEVVPEGGLAEPEVFDRNAADGILSIPESPAPARPPVTPRGSSKLIWFMVAAILLGVAVVLLVWRRS